MLFRGLAGRQKDYALENLGPQITMDLQGWSRVISPRRRLDHVFPVQKLPSKGSCVQWGPRVLLQTSKSSTEQRVWCGKTKTKTTLLSLQLPGPQEACWWLWLVRKGKGRECSKSQAFLQLGPAGPKVAISTIMDILEEKCWRLGVV